MARPYWTFEVYDDHWFRILSGEGKHWCDISPEGGKADDCPQQRSIGKFLILCIENGWLKD